MNLLVVSFSLRNPNKDYDPFFVELRGNSLNWMHYIEQTCLASTYLDEGSMAAKLRVHMDPTDSLIVAKIEPHQFNGWLPKAAWEWLHSVSNEIDREKRPALPLFLTPPPPRLE